MNYLYHYSTKGHDPLKTKEAQGFVLSPEDAKYESDRAKLTYYPDIYSRHISLFIDPVPLNIPELFDHKHGMWKSGVTLYKHYVEVSKEMDAGGPIKFILAEAPWKRDLMSGVDFDNTREYHAFLMRYAAMRAKLGEQGSGVTDLNKVVDKYKGHCNQHFGAYKNDEDYETMILPRYAAYVPHLMVYPANGELAVSKIERIKLK